MKQYLSLIIISLILTSLCTSLQAQQISIPEARYQELLGQEEKAKQLEKDLTEIDKKIQDTEAAIKKIKEDAKLQEAITERDKLTEQKTTLEKAATEEKQLQTKKDSLEGIIKKLEGEIAEKQASLAGLEELEKRNQAANEALEQTKSQYEQDKVNYTDTKKTALEQEKARLITEKSKWEQAQADYTKSKQDLAAIKKKIAELKNLQNAHANTLNGLAPVEGNYQKAKAERDTLKAILEDIKK
jgi:chromosome segregation ATPase